jgi:hypothetical protein
VYTQGSGQIATTGSSNYQGSSQTGIAGNAQWNSAINYLNSQTGQSSTSTSLNSGLSSSGQSSSGYSDPNCKTVNPTQSFCDDCYPSFYYSPQQLKCVPVNPLCKTYTKTNVCLTCYGGYMIQGVTCVIDTNYKTVGSGDVNCKSGSNGFCSECYKGFYFNNSQGKCVVANPLCKTYTNDNRCTSCYPGYFLSQTQGTCLIDNSGSSQGQGVTSQTSTSGQSSQQGQQGQQGQSTTSNIYTNTNSYGGNSGNVVNSGYSSGSTQTGGNTQMLPNGNTLFVFGAYYIEFNTQGQIVNIYPVGYLANQQQTTYSNSYGGQNQQSGQSSSQSNQPNQWSSSSQTGQQQTQQSQQTQQAQQTQCYHRQVPKNGQCVNVSDTCQTWDNITGACTSCYGGYTIENGGCVVKPPQ